MKIIRKIIAACVTFFSGPGARALHDVGGALLEHVGPTLLADLMAAARRAILVNEAKGGVVDNEVKHARAKSLLRSIAAEAGVTLSDTALDIIIKGALLLVRKGN